VSSFIHCQYVLNSRPLTSKQSFVLEYHVHSVTTDNILIWICKVKAIQPSARGYKWPTLFLRDINTGTWLSRFGGVSETVKYGYGFGPLSDYTANCRSILWSKRALTETRPLSSDRK
jgi:hypothetical protein